MKKKKFKWGILGTASISKTIIDAIRLSGHDVYAIASRSPKKSIKFAKEINITKTYSSYGKLLNDKVIDIVYIPLPNSEHYKWIKKSIIKKKHVLCEKPICTSVKKIDEIISLSKKNKIIVSEALMYRHHPQIIKLKKLIKSNTIGKINNFKGKFYYEIKEKKNIRFKKKLDGGSLWDLGYYLISLINYIFSNDIDKISAQIKEKIKDVDSKFYGKILFKDKLLAELNSSFVNKKNDSIEIIGAKGVIKINSAFLRKKIKKISIIKNNKEILHTFKEDKHRYIYQIEDLVDAINNVKKNEVSLAESKKNIYIATLLLSSAYSQKEIYIN